MFATSSPSLKRTILDPEGKVALVGVGGFGQFCLEAYQRAGDIAVLSAADPRLAGSTPRGYPCITIESDWRTVLDNPSIEVVHLATPPFLRASLGVPALRAGKSIFCEKPLALSLEEADELLDVMSETGRTVGVDYVMRHHPAFALLNRFASSGFLGPLRTFSLQNFAQALPDDHWMWDETKSGGILVEHGVHFFDAYGQIAGRPNRVYGIKPRRQAVQVTVEYAGGALGTYYHEFAFPQAIERTHAMVLFDQGVIEIEGWIPERMYGSVLASAQTVRSVVHDLALRADIEEDAAVTRFEIPFPDRLRGYQDAVVAGLRDLVAKHRDSSHIMAVSAQNARDSLALALAGRVASEMGIAMSLTEA